MAASYSQLGSLLTEIGKVEESVGYTLASLVFYLQVGAPEASVNLYWLARQQEQLGEAQFRTVVHRHLGEQDTENLLQLLKGIGGGAVKRPGAAFHLSDSRLMSAWVA